MFHSFASSSSSAPSLSDQPLFLAAATVDAPHVQANGFLSPLRSSAPHASSLPCEYFLPRSSSAHSLLLHPHHMPDSTNAPQPPPPPPPYSPSRWSSSSDYLDFNASPMRRVLSAGDIQVTQKVVGRYSTEERKERIERYRSKRNHRNFHKKITYACRKTLADSRPRTRGRFARNGETETSGAAAGGGAERFGYGDHEQNQGFYADDDVNGGGAGDWRSQLQAALDESGSCYDDDLLASFADVISMNILS